MVKQSVVPLESIAQTILVLRGQKVILDADLARLYGVTTKRLNEQVKRNQDRFPDDFVFQLVEDEKRELVANCDRFNNLKHSSAYPYVFTEHGALIAASVLNTPRAVEISVYVVRAFVRLRQMLSANTQLAQRLDELEQRLESRLDKHDEQIAVLMRAIKQLMTSPDPPERRIASAPGTLWRPRSTRVETKPGIPEREDKHALQTIR